MLKNIFFGLLCMTLVLISTGCKKSCGLNCLHGGSCAGSVCTCPDPYSGKTCDTLCTLGYEGYMCQTLSRERFIGTWSCTATDQYGNSQKSVITFSDDPYPVFMDMGNFNNNSSYPIICTLAGKYNFDINAYQQGTLATAAGVNGYGKLNNAQLVMYISIGSYNYFVTGSRQ